MAYINPALPWGRMLTAEDVPPQYLLFPAVTVFQNQVQGLFYGVFPTLHSYR